MFAIGSNNDDGNDLTQPLISDDMKVPSPTSDDDMEEEEKSLDLDTDDMDDSIEMQSMQSVDGDGHVDGVRPALCVMYRLAGEPSGDSRAGLMNVELMGYDECYQNLSLTVDTYHSGSWTDGKYMLAFLVLIQCLFLPFFILFPPYEIITFFNTKFKVTPRYRPVGAISDPFKDLDRTEQVPYDITAMWSSRSFSNDKYINNFMYWVKMIIIRKVIPFSLSVILLSVVYGGPILYNYKQQTAGVEDLSF